MNIDELKEAMLDNKDIEAFVNNLIAEKVTTEVTGLKTKNTELLDEKKTLQTKLENVPSDKELEEFKAVKNNIDNSLYAKLISEGKLDEVVDSKVERIIADNKTKEVEFKSVITKLRDENEILKSDHTDYVLDDTIRKVALKAGVTANAIDDVARRAKGLFSIDPDRTIVARNIDGHLIVTKDEKTLTPEIFVAELKESAPHFWPQSKSAELQGSLNDSNLIKAASSGDIDSYLQRRRKQRKAEQA